MTMRVKKPDHPWWDRPVWAEHRPGPDGVCEACGEAQASRSSLCGKPDALSALDDLVRRLMRDREDNEHEPDVLGYIEELAAIIRRMAAERREKS